MRHRRRVGNPSLACVLLTVAGCVGTESSAPTVDALRLSAVLQIETTSALPSNLSSRAQDTVTAWTPPIDAKSASLFLPALVIEVSDTVRVGSAVSIVVNSIGESGCWQSDGGTLTQRGDSALIVAYDRHSGAQVCTMVWTDRLRHLFTTSFPSAGIGTIRVHGRRIRQGAPSVSLPVVAQRTVVVIP